VIAVIARLNPNPLSGTLTLVAITFIITVLCILAHALVT
jgi:hypothetical protein